MRRFLGILGILLLFGLVGGLAYSAGLAAAGVAPAAGAAAPDVVYPYWGWGFGWFGFGHLLFGLFFLFLIFGLLRFAFWGGRRRGFGPGYGPAWGHHMKGDPRETWIRDQLDEWHRSAHEAKPGSGSTPSTSGGAPTDGGSGQSTL